ncbi:MAG: alpha-2-macroglobulin family protein, partial [Treponema sp.]
SMYKPKNPETDFSHLPFPQAKFYSNSWKARSEYWDLYGDLIEDDNFWYQRKNPCHPAFYLSAYNYDLVAKKDILVSNLALIVKKDVQDGVYVRVCDIRTGKIVEGAIVKAYSFAQREIASSKTDKEGSIFFENLKDVFFIQAEKDGSFAYLKVNEGSQMSTSHFAVDGEVSKEGIKGYIYGERGIWRPGDEIHLCFILQDTKNTLPKDIPLEFTLSDVLSTEIDRQILNSSVGRIYRIDTKTAKDAKTGTYIARVKIGGNTWQKEINVESIIPNRLFVKLEPNNYLHNGENNITLSSQWLHGAKASGLKAEVDLKYVLDNSPFKDWSGYSFISEHDRFSTISERLWDGTLNEEGIANIKVAMNVEKAPGKLKAVFGTRVYESSGAFSTENKVLDFSPYSAYVGILLPKGDDSYRNDLIYTNKDNSVSFVIVDKDGKLIKQNRKIILELYRLDWKWWWEEDAYTGSIYSSSSSITNKLSTEIETIDGRGKWTFNIKDEDWGRYLLVAQDNEGGHVSSSIFYVDTPYWSSRSSNGTSDAESILILQAGKEKYKSGETVEVSFPSATDSFAYITLEKGGKIIERQVIKGTGKTCKYTFNANANMAPNVYVHVSLLQPYKNTKNSLPIRLYGIIPIKIENEESHLEPILLVKDSFEANKKASFKVKEKNGRKMAFTIAVVDEGLLGLTNFKMANPWNHFYRKEASSLASYDMFNSISGAFNGRIESMLAIGGSDESLETSNGSKKAERFKSVALLLGPYIIEAKEEKTIEFEMPQYIGAVRLMLVATEGVSYGVKEETVRVSSPLIVIPTFPRTFGIGEDMEVPITVFNGTNKDANIKVSLKGEGAITMAEEKTITVEALQNETVSFNVKAERKGKSIFTIEGKGNGNLKAASFIEIDSISRGTPYISVRNELLQGKEEKTLEIELPGEVGTRELSLEISRFPSLGLENRLSYLLEYPSGCLEQITSKAFSHLYLTRFLELSNEEAEKRKENIYSVLQRLPSYQISNGGFSYWPSGNTVASWASIYAFHFMVEAKKMGFNVEDSLYKRCLEYQVDSAKTWKVGYRNNPEEQAYRLYVLALSGRSDLQSMNKFKTVDDLSSLAKSLLANAYILIGKKDVGKSLASTIELHFEHNRRGLQNYGSSLRDVAMQLQTYTLLEDRNEKVNNCILALANASNSDEYLSTNEIAQILISLSPYYNYKKAASLNIEVNSKNEKQDVTLNMNSKVLKLKTTSETKQIIKVKNKNVEPIYVSLLAKSTLPQGNERKEEKGGLSLDVRYTKSDRNVNIDDSSNLPIKAVNFDNIKKGDRFFIFITAKNKSNVKLDNLVLSLPIPTGWEISNARIADITSVKKYNYDYQDIQDTHVYTYFSLSSGEEKNFIFEATSVYEGKYYLPSIVLESMYDPSYRAVFKN